jgi:hypothetical protein
LAAADQVDQHARAYEVRRSAQRHLQASIKLKEQPPALFHRVKKQEWATNLVLFE